ncbi:kinesin-like protein KIN-7N isoform X2 [Punica granatum]|uniref:Kinesin-like protein n=1 Tax=Punica granatum TaxID=22663 RepID=A0A218X7G3_PUNGR|nr:kinesin-like protein KIN-7N isoform X2 [Punica granatum]OWM80620.1 hypothetical protein CDL15_Pgr006650 [Punica granatum]
MEKICVAVRVRPFVSEESINGAFWKVEDNRISLHRIGGTPVSSLSYAFDHVFDESCTNAAIYSLLTRDVIHAAVEGFNGTAFAYGQTSSGKTFTMNGSDADPGIIHLAVRDVFDKIQKTSDREFLIRISYMEIYNEEINDLFAVESQKLQIHESLERGIYVAGLKEEIVNDADEVLKLIESGEVNRHFGETNMNARSSRSHTIFRMVIESREKDTNMCKDRSTSDAIRVSVLNLVDLAGSERIAKTGADGVRLKEGKHINKSLMVLGNVINKLSEGVKQRGHIPYRDSKLTRILQPALGGNAKTSIICTVAPEEVHIEETKGTLQFASRAKRVTNCAQVNEVLTDAALLKRQKLEIEELRQKLQGSHAEVLEKEILKLRNEMLKYELEREKLAMELEEERRSQKECQRCIKEQQIKIDNLSSLVSFSDCDKSSSQAYSKESCLVNFSDSKSINKDDAFGTPSFKGAPNSFVVKRSNYSGLSDHSPLPDNLSTVADEETWFMMNKGYMVDLDSIQMTPARKVQSFPPSSSTPGGGNESYSEELQDVKKKLELAIEEREELERKNKEQELLNNQLMNELSKLQQDAKLSREIPQRLSQSVSNCKDVYTEVISNILRVPSDGKSSPSKLHSGISEIGSILLTTLESHLKTLMRDKNFYSKEDSLLQEHCESLRERLSDAVALLASNSQSAENEQACLLSCCENKDCALGGELAACQGNLISGFDAIKEKFHGLQRELDESNRLLKDSKVKYHGLETEFLAMKDERDSLLRAVSESTQKASLATEQKEKALKDLFTEVQRRKYLEENIKEFSTAFVGRQKFLHSFHGELKSKLERLEAENKASVPKSLGH